MAHWEIVDLKGAVEMILGRSWLRDLGAVHDYGSDKIMVRGNGTLVRLQPAQEDRRVMVEVDQPIDGAVDLQSDEILTFDSGEQALRVLPHPCEDLCTSADDDEIVVETCTGGADEGRRVTNPSRAGPRSTAAIPSSMAPRAHVRPTLSSMLRTTLMTSSSTGKKTHAKTSSMQTLPQQLQPTVRPRSLDTTAAGHPHAGRFLRSRQQTMRVCQRHGDWRPSKRPSLSGSAAGAALELGGMYAARYQKTRTERRKETQQRRLKNAHQAAQLLDEALREAAEQNECEVRPLRELTELNAVAAAWESTAVRPEPPTQVLPAEVARIAFDRLMQSERITNPNGAERLDHILTKIEIGDAITPEQRDRVIEVLRRYGDCYVEDVKVLPVNLVTHITNYT
ncbi:hypothetical protein B0H13DRAFT_1928316 [Mycena leptocephala]|nr:hypothetical protein B0H13DRAFT_1928316 [Mycena leptocephala]